VETALDVEWAHVIAPNASILLVEANSPSDTNLYAAVDTARNRAGVSVVSMSWGSDETSADSAFDAHFTTPSGHNGVTFVASSGDNGRYSNQSPFTRTVVGYPAVSPNVVGIGGTRLTTGSGGAYVSESGWGNGTSSGRLGGSGGGISTIFHQPSYQHGVVTQSSTFRTVPDVSFDADPASGVPVYDAYDNGSTTPWDQVGGTSLAAPMWGGVIALVDQGRAQHGLGALDGPTGTLPSLYALPASDLHDITTGNNGYAAGPGYDLVTGRGTPIVNLLVRDLAGPATPVPTIGSFTVSPASVPSGGTVTLTAADVGEAGGTVTAVTFYLESDGIPGLQTDSDTLLGAGTQSGSSWSLPLTTTGFAAGAYTLYAVATDAAGTSSDVASAALTVTGPPTPTIGSFTVSPASVPAGVGVTLTAANVGEVGGTVTGVSFYLESDGIPGLQTDSDTLLGAGTQSGSSWSLALPTDGFAAGVYTLYAIASDAAGTSSAVASAALTVTGPPTPTIGSFTVSPATVLTGGSVTLTAANVGEAGGTVTGVSFYLESDGIPGLQTDSDTLLGAGTQSGSSWSLPLSTAGFPAGAYTLYAVATDAAGTTSAVASAALTVIDTLVPTIGSFTVSPATVLTGGSVTLTAANVGEAGGAVTGVSFYLESDGIPGLQTDSDTLLGAGTQSGSSWSLALSTAGFPAGAYTLYAVATDAAGTTSAAASATLTVTSSAFSGVLLGWDVAGLSNFGPQGLAAGQVAGGVSNSLGLTRGSGVSTSGTAAANAWGGDGWAASASAGLGGNKFVTFGLTVSAGEVVSLSSLDLYYRHSPTGPTGGYWQYQLNGGAWQLIGDFPNEFPSTSTSGAAMAELSLGGVGGLQNLAAGTTVAFRLVPYGATSSAGTWYVYNQPGYDLVLNGTVQGAAGGAAAPQWQPAGGAGLADALLAADRRPPSPADRAGEPAEAGRPTGERGAGRPAAAAAPAGRPERVGKPPRSANDLFWEWHAGADAPRPRGA
jgi:hypothetical protein